MAVCTRCGKKFNYEKRDGVCPECCFYNRPEGTYHEDQDWVKKYRYEETEYTLNKHSVEAPRNARESFTKYLFARDENDVGATLRDAFDRNRHREVDGSHVHMEDGKVVRGSRAMYKAAQLKKKADDVSKEQNVNMGKNMIGIWFFVVFILFFFFNILLGF